MNLKQRKNRKVTPVYCRKIERNKIKQKNGCNQIKLTWRALQIKRYGISKWCYMFNKSNRNNKSNYITPKEAMHA